MFGSTAETNETRPGEVDGVNYHFMTREQFEKLLEEDAFLEHAEYVGNFYGTPKAPVVENAAMGKIVFLEIEIRGYEQVKKKLPQAVSVFIAPPSLEELEKRLRGRSTETEEKLRGRLKKAAEELTYAPQFDHVVVNDDVERAASEIISLIHSYNH